MIEELKYIKNNLKIDYTEKFNLNLFFDKKNKCFNQPTKNIIFEGRNMFFTQEGIFLTHKVCGVDPVCFLDFKNMRIVRTKRYENDKEPYLCFFNLIKYIEKYKELFEQYLEKKPNIVEPLFTTNNMHWGHVLADGAYNSLEMTYQVFGSKNIVIYKNSFYHKNEDFKYLFDCVKTLKDDEESFLYSMENNNFLFMFDPINERTHPKTFDKKLKVPECIKKIQQQKFKIKKNKIKIGLVIKKDYRYALNQIEFYKKIIEFFNDSKYEIYLIGVFYIQSLPNAHYYRKLAIDCQKICEEIKQERENVHILNGIEFFELEKSIFDLDFYITPPGSQQHLLYFFAFNSKGLCYGCSEKILNGHWRSFNRPFGYMILDDSYVEYLTLDEKPVSNIETAFKDGRNYNVLIKLDGIEKILDELINQ